MNRILLLLLVIFAFGCGPAKTQTRYGNGTGSGNNTYKARTGPVSWPKFQKWDESRVGTNDVAVIIAIENYAFLPSVPGAIETANDWESFFRSRGTSEIFILTNDNAPAEEIRRFAKQAASEVPAGGTLWFVFVGHGAAKTDGTDGLLVAMDAQQNVESLESRSVSQTDLVATLDKGKQANTVVVLDTCFSGRSADGKLLAKGTQPVVPITKSLTTTSGFAIFGAAAADQVAGQLPGSERPAFSYLMLGALRGWGDRDGDGTVTTDEAIQYTQRQLRYLKGRVQTPSLNGTGDIAIYAGKEKDPGVADLIKNDGRGATADDSGGPKNLEPTTPMITRDNRPFKGADYGIVFPKNWQVRTRIADTDVMGDPNDGTNITNVAVVLYNTSETLAAWFDIEMAASWRSGPNYKLLSAEDTTVAGLPAKKIQYEDEVDGMRRFVIQWYFKKGNGGYQINALVRPEDFAKYGKVFKAVIDSIVIE